MKFPERVLADLPEDIVKRIKANEDLDSSESRVAKTYLEKTIMHPENACNSELEAIGLVRFYMAIGAKIPRETVDYMRLHISHEPTLAELAEYDNVVDEVRVNLSTSPLRNQSFLSICHINSDKGFRRWNLYAENYSKLVKSITRWVESEASHLKMGCEYDVYIDDYNVGRIKRGRSFAPNPACDMYGFIIKFFEPPVRLDLVFALEETNDCDIENCYNLECRVSGDKKHSSMVVLPSTPEMKMGLISKSITDVSKKVLDLTRFQESMSCDIEGVITLNGEAVGVIDVDCGEPKLNDAGESYLKDFCGVVDALPAPEPTIEEPPPKLTIMQRLKLIFS